MLFQASGLEKRAAGADSRAALVISPPGLLDSQAGAALNHEFWRRPAKKRDLLPAVCLVSGALGL